MTRGPGSGVAVVTGAADGIGATIAERLCSECWNVIGLSRRADALEVTRTRLEALPGAFHGVVGDVQREHDLEQAFEIASDAFGFVSAVVANSGIEGPTTPIAETTLADWCDVIATNLTGAFVTVRAAVPHLRRNGSGRIVLIGSTTGKNPVPYRGAYAASKTGLIGLTRALSAELGPEQITVNLVCPGVVLGPRWERVRAAIAAAEGADPSSVETAYANESLLKRLVDPVEVADAVSFLLSPRAAAITGQDMNVCAGLIVS